MRIPPLLVLAAVAATTTADVAVLPNHGAPHSGLDLDQKWTSYQGSKFPSELLPKEQWERMLCIRTATPTRLTRSGDWP